MDLRDYARTLRKRWVLVVVATMLALGVAAVATLLATAQYTSTAQIFVSALDTSESTSGAYQGGLLAQQQVKTYAGVAASPTVTDKVAIDLGLSPLDLADQVTAEAPLDTVLINLTATATSPESAQAIAQAVADEATTLIPELERPDGRAQPPVKLTVIKDASLPLSPSSPRPRLNLLLGLLVGLATGVGVAVLRETLDTTVKGKDDLQQISGAAPLGVIADDHGVAVRPLVVQIDAQSPRAESFRQLRSNLQFIDVDRPTRAVVVTSPVAGEGKSTTACNLAITLAQAGIRTILVEADLRRPRVSAYLGIEGAVGLTSVLTGAVLLDDALQAWGRDGMLVLPGGPLPPNPSEILGSHHMLELMKALDERADIVVVDAPPLLPVTDAAVMARITDGALLVVRHGHTRREQVTRAVEALKGVDARMLGTVLNRSPQKGPEADAYGYGYGYQGARDEASKLGRSQRSRLVGGRGKRGKRRPG